MLLLATGLLALLALSNAGGHHIKGGSHIKGLGTQIIPQEIHQEEANLNIQSAAAFRTKTVVPVAPQVDLVSRKGTSTQGVIEFREPVAKPVVEQPIISAIKTVPPVVVLHDQQHSVKTASPSNVKTLPPIVAGDQSFKTVVGKGLGTTGTVDVISPRRRPVISSPLQAKPQILTTSPLKPELGADIITLNRQLIEKQRQEDLKRTLSGVVKSDVDIAKVSLSTGELEEISKRLRTGANAGILTEEAIRQVNIPAVQTVRQRIPVSIPQRPKIQVLSKPQISVPVSLKPQVTSQSLPRPQLGEDIITLNRQLIEKQKQEDLKKTLSGVIRDDTDFSRVSLSTGELDEISKRIGGRITGNVNAVQGLKIPAVVTRAQQPQKRIPAAVRPKVSTITKDERFKFTGARISPGLISGTGITTSSVGSAIQGENIQFVLGNTVGTVGGDVQRVSPLKPQVTVPVVPKPQIRTPIRPVLKVPVVPKPQIISPVLQTPQVGSDILSLNRQLIEKQNQEDIKRTLSGVIRTDSDIGNVALSTGDIDEIQRRLSGGVGGYIVPTSGVGVTQIKPAVVRQRIPAGVKPNIVAGGAQDKTFSYTGSRTTFGTRRRITGGKIPEGENYFILGNAFETIGGTRYKTRGTLYERPQTNIQGAQRPQISMPVVPKPKLSVPVLTQPQLGADIITLNRQLIEKQNQEDIKRTLSGVVRTDSDIGNVALSTGDIDEIQRRLSGGVGGYIVPTSGAGVTQIKPAVVRQRIPAGVKPKIVAGGTQDKTLSYTGSRTTFGTRRRITGGKVPEGENYFILGNAIETIGGTRYRTRGSLYERPQINIQGALKPQPIMPIAPKPKFSVPVLTQPELGADIITLNRQLIEKQNQEDLTQTLSGVVTGSDINRISLTSGDLNEVSKRLGTGAAIIPVPKVIKPTVIAPFRPAVVRQRTPSAVTRIVTKPLLTAPVAPIIPYVQPKPEVPVAFLPQEGLNADIVALNRQLIQKQNQEDLEKTLSGVITVDGNIDRVSLSSGDLDEVSRRLGTGVVTPVIPSPEAIQPVIITPIQPKIAETTIAVFGGRSDLQSLTPVLPNQPVSLVPISGIQPVQYDSDIIQLNRQLIEKQNQEDLKKTLSGVVTTDSDIGALSLSAGEVGEISRKLVGGVGERVISTEEINKPEAIPRSKPVSVRQRIPVAIKPAVPSSTAPRAPVTLNVSPAFGGRIKPLPEVLNRPLVSSGRVDIRTPVATPIKPQPEITIDSQPQTELSDDIITLNRNLIDKQNNDEFLQTLRGVVRSDALDGVPVSSDALKDLSEIVGYNSESRSDVRPQLNLVRSDVGLGSRSGAGVRGAINIEGVSTYGLNAQQIVRQDRIETPVVIQENVQPALIPDPSVRKIERKVIRIRKPVPTFSPVDQQQVKPIVVSGSQAPTITEQQKLEQILV